ncbi:Transcription initiation factor IIA large subunit [Astathelohania contejeani]|uniref:Transcription initiation factor IIA large subunit n=1 Tax=Astathelohania contejeani TaxID=164912 RepID=A0ABQ7HWV4_9MICR|nr:Transcription initiation factor IIA large subunit [Thelohania contejeani]
MNYEMSRVYRDIIDTVINSLDSSQDALEIDPQLIHELRCDWTRRIQEYIEPSEPTIQHGLINRVHFQYGQKHYTNIPQVSDKIYNNTEKEFESDELGSTESEEEKDNGNFIMCLYEKVSKSKNRWRVTLKQGFLNIGNMDFAFSTAHGDLEW